MKHDLDRLMSERNLDAFVVDGPDGYGSANPDFNYFVNGAHLIGTVIKRRGEPAMLIYSEWERLQAETTGLVLVSKDRWNIHQIMQQYPDLLQARIEYRRQMFTDLGIRGRVGFYGTVHSGRNFALLKGLSACMPDLEIVTEYESDIISLARQTKDAAEIEEMRRVGRKTCEVVQAVVDHIRTGRAQGDIVVGRDGKPITIGDIKRLISREMALRSLEEPSGTIFAQGRDAGLPHATGEETAELRLGQAIVFDIFPRELGGYYHDMTRTFAIGYAPPELQQTYDQVLEVFDRVIEGLKVGQRTKTYQDMVCTFFEEHGHPTIGTTYPIDEGYIHGLGHGIGLEVHEQFRFSAERDTGEILEPGVVFTVEPGLYYPSKGYGVRLEDTLYCTPEGHFESLTPFPKQLVIPLDR